MTTCPKCQTLNPQGERICLACGAGLVDYNATTFESSGTTCPNGHPIDPSWSNCPYCTREQTAGPISSPKATVIEDDTTRPLSADALRMTSRTRLEGQHSPLGGGPAAKARQTRLEGEPSSTPAPPGPPVAARSRRTRLEGADPELRIPAVSASGRAPGPPAVAPLASREPRPTRLESSIPATRRTVLRDEPPMVRTETPPAAFATPAPAPPVGVQTDDAHNLVAVLGAPGLGPGGAVFPIRSGKNFIGAGASSEVCLRQDREVSSEHALILHRGGIFYLADRMSTNGTWINGKEVDATSPATILKDRDRIRCGKTELVFLAIAPPSSDSEGSNDEES